MAKEFKPPKKDKAFLYYWNKILSSIDYEKQPLTEIELKSIAILCEFYLEYDHLHDLIQEEGYLITNVSPQGVTTKSSPLVSQKNQCIRNIHLYSNGLGITRIAAKTDDSQSGNDEEWS